MIKTIDIIKKIFKTLFFILISLAVLGVLALVFWAQVKEWIYGVGFMGNDTPQFIHYVIYHFKHPGFPINSWDYLWHNGAPRVLDATWINFFFTNPMVQSLGFYQTVKIYPLISFGIFALFTYLIFYELSRSVLLSLGMTISFLLGQGLYEALFRAGVVMSAISQVFFPIQFYFLARFHRRRTYKNLYLAGFMSALGFYFHGALMMFFGFIPSFIFVLFSTHKEETFISIKSIKNSLIFTVIALGVGALGTWPQLLHGFIGGSNSVLIPGPGPRPTIETIRPMIKFTDPGIPIAFVISLLVCLYCFIFNKNRTILREGLPFVIIFAYAMSWFLSCNWGLNPICGILFPGRSFWAISVTLGALAAFFLSPLSESIKNQHFAKKILKWLFLNTLKIAIFILIAINLFIVITGGYFLGKLKIEPVLNITLLRPYDPADFSTGVIQVAPLADEDLPKAATASAAFLEKIKVRPIPKIDLEDSTRAELGDLYTVVDHSNLNYRVWTHMQGISLVWTRVSDVPLSSGYFHFWTKNSRLWEGWTYAVMSRPNYESQEIPRDMAEKQALFFLDWYGARYVLFSPGSGEWDLAPYLYKNTDYLDVEKSNPEKGYLTLNPEIISGVVSSVSSPVIGFVGDDESYMTFLKDIAMLNLNTSYLIPVKVADSLGGIDSSKLSSVDVLVLYDFKEGGFLFSNSWGKISDFVKNGGRVWIEGGGNSFIREKSRLPDVLPVKASKYGPLGSDWEMGGELVGKIDPSSLEKLVYRETPWQVSYAAPDKVKPGARVLLTQKGYPVAVSQDFGKGKVLWTGVNFWYRPEEYRKNGMNEIKFISLFLEELLGELVPKRATADVERKAPEKITVEGQNFSGVVFKENRWPGWTAKVSSSGKTKAVPIFTAGPELMYIPVPQEMRSGEMRVDINYRGDPFHWLAFFVSILSFLVVLDLLTLRILPKVLPLNSLMAQVKKRFTFKISQWWEKEDEEQG